MILLITDTEGHYPLFRELGNRNGTAEALCELGGMTLAQGDTALAAIHFAESLALFARVLGKKASAAGCLVGLAEVAAAQARPVRAARLFGAAQALRELVRVPLRSTDRGSYERSVAAVRAQLDEATFAAAWAERRAMSLEPAVEYALSATTPARAP